MLSVVGISCAAGALVGLAVTGGTSRGLFQGALSGVAISLAVDRAGRLLARSGIHRWAFGAYLAGTALVNGVAICGGLAAAALPWAITQGVGDASTYLVPFVFAVAMSLAFTFWFTLGRLLGGDVLTGLLTGRYHHPRLEERIFLFGDLVGSTGIAERLGEQQFHSFLNRVWMDVAAPVQEHGGVIHRYLGDEIEINWSFERGRHGAACLRCALAILDVMAAKRSDYSNEFGNPAQLRLALHSGPVVAGEMGGPKREIVYSGDTVHTTSRIEGVAKETNRDLLVSVDLLRALEVPEGCVVEPLGAYRLRGKEREVELFAVAAAAP
jgi:adenylate cyclase